MSPGNSDNNRLAVIGSLIATPSSVIVRSLVGMYLASKLATGLHILKGIALAAILKRDSRVQHGCRKNQQFSSSIIQSQAMIGASNQTA